MGTQKEKEQALINAASTGGIKAYKLLLEQGADIHTGEDLALRVAASKGHTETCKTLLGQGADIHVENDCPYT